MDGAPVKQGWFTTQGRLGDRTLEQQMIGLDRVRQLVKGKSVLDVGCAEGLISIEMAKAGARMVHGVEIVRAHVDCATELAYKAGVKCGFYCHDANLWTPDRPYDVILLLSILHRFRDPSAAASRFARSCTEWCIVRLPPKDAPTIVDWRSGEVPHHIARVMTDEGFHLEQTALGPLDEWVGYFRRAE